MHAIVQTTVFQLFFSLTSLKLLLFGHSVFLDSSFCSLSVEANSSSTGYHGHLRDHQTTWNLNVQLEAGTARQYGALGKP